MSGLGLRSQWAFLAQHLSSLPRHFGVYLFIAYCVLYFLGWVFLASSGLLQRGCIVSLKWKCITPKTREKIILRLKSIAHKSIPVTTIAAMFAMAITFADNWWIVSSTAGAVVVLLIDLAKVPFSVQGPAKEGDKHCGNPLLQNDEQMIADGVYTQHACLAVGSIWLAMIAPVLLWILCWGLFAKWLASPWGL